MKPPRAKKAPSAVGVLDEVRHRRLIADIRRYAEIAGVTPEHIMRGLDDYCGDQEADWVRKLLRARQKGLARLPAGLAYRGRVDRVDERMRGLAGCLVRNFVDARVVSADDLVSDPPDCTVLLVPTRLDSLHEWRREKVAGELAGRLGRGLSVVAWFGAEAALGDSLVAQVKRLERVQC